MERHAGTHVVSYVEPIGETKQTLSLSEPVTVGSTKLMHPNISKGCRTEYQRTACLYV